MTANVGTLDRALRAILGMILVILPFIMGPGLFDSTALKFGSIAVGGILVLTAAIRFCPLYRLVGIKTCQV